MYHLFLYYYEKCNTFTPQIKGVPEDTFAMYTSTQGDIYVNVHRCTLKCIPGKVVALLKEQATFIKASMALMWMNHLLFVLYKLKLKSIVGLNQCLCDDYHKLKCCQKQQSNEGVLVSLPFCKLENVT